MPHNMKSMIYSAMVRLRSSLGKKSEIQSPKIKSINPAITGSKILSSNTNMCILLSYNNQINSGDKNDMMTEKNIMQTIK